MANVLAKIDGFLRLEKGWHYGAGHPASSALVGRAKLLANLFSNLRFANVDAFPGIDGEIMLSAYDEGHCIELTLELDGTFRISHEENGVEVFYRENLSNFELAKYFSFTTSKVKLKEWLSSGSSIQATTTLAPESSKISPSGQQRKPLLFLASNVVVPNIEAEAYVTMPANTTDPLHSIHQSSGYSMNRSYLQAAA